MPVESLNVISTTVTFGVLENSKISHGCKILGVKRVLNVSPTCGNRVSHQYQLWSLNSSSLQTWPGIAWGPILGKKADIRFIYFWF